MEYNLLLSIAYCYCILLFNMYYSINILFYLLLIFTTTNYRCQSRSSLFSRLFLTCLSTHHYLGTWYPLQRLLLIYPKPQACHFGFCRRVRFNGTIVGFWYHLLLGRGYWTRISKFINSFTLRLLIKWFGATITFSCQCILVFISTRTCYGTIWLNF